VPALLVSAYAKRGYVDNTVLDYTSYLKFIEDNWDLEPLTERDAQANSIINAFDFSQPPRAAEFLPFERLTQEAKAEPDRRVIYILYGAMIIASAGLFALTMVVGSRRARRSAGVREELL